MQAKGVLVLCVLFVLVWFYDISNTVSKRFFVQEKKLFKKLKQKDYQKAIANLTLNEIQKILTLDDNGSLGKFCTSDRVFFADTKVEVCSASSIYCKEKGFHFKNCILMHSKYHSRIFVSSLPTVVVPGFRKCGTSYAFKMISKVINGSEIKENCLRNARMVNDWITTAYYNPDWANGCFDTEKWEEIENVLQPVGIHYVFMVRHFSSLSWASYNFWRQEGFDHPWKPWNINFTIDTPMHETWTHLDTYRSPEFYHEIILANGKIHTTHELTSYGYVSEKLKKFKNISSNVHIFPNEATSQISFFEFLQNSLKTHFTQIEELKKCEGNALNSGYRLSSRGIHNSGERQGDGRYEVSQFRPMLPETCKLLVKNWKDHCKKINELISQGFVSFTYDCSSLEYCNL